MKAVTNKAEVSVKYELYQEIWRDIASSDGLYEISNKARVRNKQTNRILTAFINTQGYKQVTLTINKKQKKVLVHRVLAEAFLINPNPSKNMVVCHLDGDPLNLDLTNLVWATQSFNLQDPKRTERLLANENYKKHVENMKKKVTLVSKSETLTFNSMNETADFLNVHVTTVRRAFKMGYELGGYTVTIQKNESAYK